MPTQNSAPKWQLGPFATSCVKDYEEYSLMQTSFTALPNSFIFYTNFFILFCFLIAHFAILLKDINFTDIATEASVSVRMSTFLGWCFFLLVHLVLSLHIIYIMINNS